MEDMTMNANNANILLVVAAIVFLILWLMALVQMLLAKHSVQSRGKRIVALAREAVQAGASLRRLSYESGRLEYASEEDEVFAELNKLVIKEKAYSNPKLSRDGLAEMVGISRKQLDDILKLKLPEGTSWQNWIERLRFEDALAMVVEHVPAERIAAECGYSSEKALDRAMKKNLGLSVAEFNALQ